MPIGGIGKISGRNYGQKSRGTSHEELLEKCGKTFGRNHAQICDRSREELLKKSHEELLQETKSWDKLSTGLPERDPREKSKEPEGTVEKTGIGRNF